jgi:hypothetical protein
MKLGNFGLGSRSFSMISRLALCATADRRGRLGFSLRVFVGGHCEERFLRRGNPGSNFFWIALSHKKHEVRNDEMFRFAKI